MSQCVVSVEYRRQADECLARAEERRLWAASAESPQAREWALRWAREWTEMAATWAGLAESADAPGGQP